MRLRRLKQHLLTLLLLVSANKAMAQDIKLDLAAGTLGGQTIEMIALISLLSILPALLIMLTCFPFMVTVLAILRQGLGLQQSPPNMLIITLALFLTWYVMTPILDTAWTSGINPLLQGQIGYIEGVQKAYLPLQDFMVNRLDVSTYAHLASLRPATATLPPAEAAPSLLIPSFLLSEISRAFQIGFLIYLPFLVIDMVVSAVLMSMGMMMVPPAAVSLPFKLAFFVAADGWGLIASSLVRSYS